jgi:hypothetical protein
MTGAFGPNSSGFGSPYARRGRRMASPAGCTRSWADPGSVTIGQNDPPRIHDGNKAGARSMERVYGGLGFVFPDAARAGPLGSFFFRAWPPGGGRPRWPGRASVPWVRFSRGAQANRHEQNGPLGSFFPLRTRSEREGRLGSFFGPSATRSGSSLQVRPRARSGRPPARLGFVFSRPDPAPNARGHPTGLPRSPALPWVRCSNEAQADCPARVGTLRSFFPGGRRGGVGFVFLSEGD